MEYLEHKEVPDFLKEQWRNGLLSDFEFDTMAEGALRQLNIASTDEEVFEAEQGDQAKQDGFMPSLA